MAGRNADVVQVLEAGLRASALRGKVIASNLANLDTPGYRRKTVSFEAAFAEALASGRADRIARTAAEIFRPMDTPVDPDGNDVSLDVEVGEMVKNSARYKTCMRALTKVYRQMELAIRTD